MNTPTIHSKWDHPAETMVDGFSIEMTARDVKSLHEAAPIISKGTPVSVTFLPGETFDDRLAALKEIRAYGFEPMPHFAARRIQSEQELYDYVSLSVDQCQVSRCFLIAGDPPKAEGPYSDSLSLLKTGVFEKHGIKTIGIGGHPEGHPNMTNETCFHILEKKCSEIEKRGMAPLLVTQFSFNAQAVLDWLKELRARGIDAPVRIGVPGPAGIATLLKFASRCGVAASASVMKKYGISLTKLVGSAGPDKLVDEYQKGLRAEHGKVRLHFYSFGGLKRTAEWILAYDNNHQVS